MLVEQVQTAVGRQGGDAEEHVHYSVALTLSVQIQKIEYEHRKVEQTGRQAGVVSVMVMLVIWCSRVLRVGYVDER